MSTDSDHQKWLQELAEECTCCRNCVDPPCEGLMAGGFCDELCFCEEEL